MYLSRSLRHLGLSDNDLYNVLTSDDEFSSDCVKKIFLDVLLQKCHVLFLQCHSTLEFIIKIQLVRLLTMISWLILSSSVQT